MISSGELCGDSVSMMVWEETNGGRRLVRPKDVGSNRKTAVSMEINDSEGVGRRCSWTKDSPQKEDRIPLVSFGRCPKFVLRRLGYSADINERIPYSVSALPPSPP